MALSHCSQAFCNATEWIPSGCCPACSSYTTCTTCLNVDGCGWSYDHGACYSGLDSFTCMMAPLTHPPYSRRLLQQGALRQHNLLATAFEHNRKRVLVLSWCYCQCLFGSCGPFSTQQVIAWPLCSCVVVKIMLQQSCYWLVWRQRIMQLQCRPIVCVRARIFQRLLWSGGMQKCSYLYIVNFTCANHTVSRWC